MQVDDGTMEPEGLPRLETDPPPPARGAAGREALARKKARRGQVSATNAANGALGAAALGQRLADRREVLSKLDNTATPLPAPLSTRTTHPWASHLANASKTASAVQSPTAPVSQLESVKFPTTPAQLYEAYHSSPSRGFGNRPALAAGLSSTRASPSAIRAAQACRSPTLRPTSATSAPRLADRGGTRADESRTASVSIHREARHQGGRAACGRCCQSR